MTDGINLVMGDDGVFREAPDPYMTLAIATEDNWTALQDAVNRGNRTRWISVEDKMPDEKEDVLVFLQVDDASRYEVAFLYNGKWRCSEGYLCVSHITHWMRLPEPPMENNGGAANA